MFCFGESQRGDVIMARLPAAKKKQHGKVRRNSVRLRAGHEQVTSAMSVIETRS